MKIWVDQVLNHIGLKQIGSDLYKLDPETKDFTTEVRFLSQEPLQHSASPEPKNDDEEEEDPAVEARRAQERKLVKDVLEKEAAIAKKEKKKVEKEEEKEEIQQVPAGLKKVLKEMDEAETTMQIARAPKAIEKGILNRNNLTASDTKQKPLLSKYQQWKSKQKSNRKVSEKTIDGARSGDAVEVFRKWKKNHRKV